MVARKSAILRAFFNFPTSSENGQKRRENNLQG